MTKERLDGYYECMTSVKELIGQIYALKPKIDTLDNLEQNVVAMARAGESLVRCLALACLSVENKNFMPPISQWPETDLYPYVAALTQDRYIKPVKTVDGEFFDASDKEHLTLLDLKKAFSLITPENDYTEENPGDPDYVFELARKVIGLKNSHTLQVGEKHFIYCAMKTRPDDQIKITLWGLSPSSIH